MSRYFDPIYRNACSARKWSKPLFRVFVVNGPWRDNNKCSQECTSQTGPERQVNILEDVSDQGSDHLGTSIDVSKARSTEEQKERY